MQCSVMGGAEGSHSSQKPDGWLDVDVGYKTTYTACQTWGEGTLHSQFLQWRNEPLMQHIGTPYQNAAEQDRENKAQWHRDCKVLQTQFSICKNHDFTV